MKKVIHPFDVPFQEGSRVRHYPVFCEINFDGEGLSITGVVGPTRGGNAKGGAGQIIMEFREYDSRGYMTLGDVRPARGWDYGMIKSLMDIWDIWHLNDMKAGCEHQRAMGWDKEKIDPTKETGWHVDIRTANLKNWAYPPVGHLTEPCPVCGYKYGTAWLKEDVPADVIEFLESLPDTDLTPAWV